MAGIISLLLGIIRLIEKLSKFYQRQQQEKEVFHGVLALHNYKTKLEKTLKARRKARLEAGGADFSTPTSDSLPDDGFRRD